MDVNKTSTFTPGPWRIGKHMTTIVASEPVEVNAVQSVAETGVNAPEYYGGNLIAESVLRYENAFLIVEAPHMYKLLNDLIHSQDKEQLEQTKQEAEELLARLTKSMNGNGGVHYIDEDTLPF